MAGNAGQLRALEVKRELEVRSVMPRFHELLDASEIVAVNSLRGARSVVALDGKPVGSADGPLRKQLSEWIGID